jgi:predicted methyltransferase
MRTGLAALAIALAVSGCSQAQGFSEEALKAAIADPSRPDRAEDATRHPLELLTLAKVKPGDKVFELIPGTGYFTRILAKTVGPQGRVYAVWPQQYARYSVAKVDALKKLATEPAFANLTVEVQPTPEIAAPEPLDLVFTSQNYHDYPAEFMGKVDPATLNKAAFKLLKPGGVFIVIDHMARPGRGMQDIEEMHRVDPATVRQQAEAAGFRFDGETKVLENATDPLDIPVFDEKVRGKTSKFAYRFVKPG